MRRVLCLGLVAIAASGASGCATVLALHPPDVTPGTARQPTPVVLEPIADEPRSAIAGVYAAPGPAAVLTSAISGDLAGRALAGGEPGGYKVRCALDRFAVRWRAALAEGTEMLVLYADLSCEARRASDGATVWRGELRGRAAASGPNLIASDADVTQRLTDRALSDASREMAADLAVRALGLTGEPSARVFGDEGQLHDTGGLDDTPYGAAALTEDAAAVDGALRAIGEHDTVMRAAAWNVAAMAAGPGEPWPAGPSLTLDDEPLVRFVQCKALARLGTPAALARLAQAAAREDHPLVREFLHDSMALRGIGLARKGYEVRAAAAAAASGATKASPVTNGTTARP